MSCPGSPSRIPPSTEHFRPRGIACCRRAAVLLLLLGSDIHMMETADGVRPAVLRPCGWSRPRPAEPGEVAGALGLAGEDAVDAHLVTAASQAFCEVGRTARHRTGFCEPSALIQPRALFSIPESSLSAEFPAPDQARRVLEAVGSGDRTSPTWRRRRAIRRAGLSSGVLSPLLRAAGGGEARTRRSIRIVHAARQTCSYRIADSNLRLLHGDAPSGSGHSPTGGGRTRRTS